MTRGVSFCSAASVEPDGFTPLHVGSVDQLQHLWKHSLLGPPGPSSEAVSFLPDKQRWQPRWGGSCTRLLGRSTRDHTRINLRRWMHIVRSWLFTACSRTGGLLSDRRTSALPLWSLTSKNMPYFFFFFSIWLRWQNNGFSEYPWGVQNGGTLGLFALLMLHPVQNTTTGWCSGAAEGSSATHTSSGGGWVRSVLPVSLSSIQ